MDANDAQRRQLGVIWAAMLAAVAVYGAVAVFLPSANGGGMDAEFVRTALSALAVGSGLAAVLVWRRSLAAGGGAPIERSALQSSAIIVWALCESVAVFGLVTVVLTGDAREFVPFGAAAAALLLLHRPARLP